MSRFCKSCKNWAIGTRVTAACQSKVEKRAAHGLDGCRLSRKFVGVLECNGLYFAAGPVAVVPQSKQSRDFLDRTAKVAGIGDEAQARDSNRRIVAIAIIAPAGRRHQPDPLIMPNHPLRDAGRIRDHSDIYSAIVLSLSALAMTLTDESAMAAAAKIGESMRPNSG